MGQTVIEKIAAAHRVGGPGARPLQAGDYLALRPRHVLTHDNTAAVMQKFAALGAARMRDPSQPVIVLDHDIQNRSAANRDKYRAIEEFARAPGLDFFAAGAGIGHQLMIERGYVVPGALVVASDSHANMYGALAAAGTPVVRTDAAAIWATGEFWWQVPRTVAVVLEGALPEGASGKDVISALCGLYTRGEVRNAALEFSGPGLESLDMDARLTIANMSTEWGALAAWFPADATARAYLESREARRGAAAEDAAALGPDPDAHYAARIVLDLAAVTPYVLGPDSVRVLTPIAEMEARRVAVDKAYLVSCAGARFTDFAAAARVLRGQKVSARVEFYVAAASREIQERAEAAGVWQDLLDAGARPLPPGCGPCIGLGAGLLAPGETGISATNRNFKGRMGARDARCFLSSPAVVAASALKGFIAAPATWPAHVPARDIAFRDAPAAPPAPARVLEGFPARLAGRLVFVPQDDLNTDLIYGKDYTYREDVSREQMASVLMQGYDPEFAARARPGDVLACGENFGSGSSREQAATALQARGVSALIAASFSQTYLRNALNNGLICVESPAFVACLKEAEGVALAAGRKTIIPGAEVEIDFAAGSVRYGGRAFFFPPLSEVPQRLVIAGGVENLVRSRLAASGT
ncbi:MAG: homoaconitase [Planctomycetes bacterium]|nr:homoaconitase [Planctomycetota bacterium]